MVHSSLPMSLIVAGTVFILVLILADGTNGSIITQEATGISMQNGFVSVTLDLTGGAWISSLRGDFLGGGQYSENLLSTEGFRLEREDADGSMVTAAGKGAPAETLILQDDDLCGVLQINGVLDDIELSMVQETWELSLCANARSLILKTRGRSHGRGKDAVMYARSVHHTLYALPTSTTGFFNDGVVQILNAEDDISHFPSVSGLSRAYLMGGVGAIDIQRPSASGGEHDQVVLLNAQAGSKLGFTSGVREILVGSLSSRDEWSAGSVPEDAALLRPRAWTREWQFAPNDRNFPSSGLPTGVGQNLDDADDIESLMTGIYGSSVPCLCTYPGEVQAGHQVAQIATTLRDNRSRGYNGTYNYFDPDNFFGLSAMLDSGDEYLMEQVRLVVERTGTFMKNETGQLPHHFEGLEPYYLALSGETQTGPNTFWTKTALSYAAASGNTQWLRDYMPTLRIAASFVFDLIDPKMDLVFAPGSLMIDVFIRNNYTADSNAMVVGFLREFAAAERFLGEEDRALELEATAERVSEAINKRLWAGSDAGGDHYITQLNADGTTRDFVDYDANLIAVAHAVPDDSRARAIQQRVDAGRCSAASGAGPQFVSEIYYGEEDTTSGNTGDSWCSMARIGWFDALGRKRLGSEVDQQYFTDSILAPVQQDVITGTWMHERYGCDGLQQENRTMYYFEYPSLVAMLVREIRYGLRLGLDVVKLSPFGSASSFELHLGGVDVSYSAEYVELSVPGHGLFQYVVAGLNENAEYAVDASEGCHSLDWLNGTATSDNEGVLRFEAPRGTLASGCVVSLQQQ